MSVPTPRRNRALWLLAVGGLLIAPMGFSPALARAAPAHTATQSVTRQQIHAGENAVSAAARKPADVYPIDCTAAAGATSATGAAAAVTFDNPTAKAVEIYHVDQQGQSQKEFGLARGKSRRVATNVGNVFLAESSKGSCIATYIVPPGGGQVTVSKDTPASCSGGCGASSACDSEPITSAVSDSHATVDAAPHRAAHQVGSIAWPPFAASALAAAPFGYLSSFGLTNLQPAIQALQTEGYSVQSLNNQSAGGSHFTVDDFVNAVNSNPGVLVFIGHGNDNALDVETQTNPDFLKGRRALGRRLAYLLQHGWAKGDLTGGFSINWNDLSAGAFSFNIDITAQGLQNHLHLKNALVYLVACESGDGPVANALVAAGARQVFGYQGRLDIHQGTADVQRFWQDMDGTAHPDANINDPRTRLTTNALADCQNGGGCKGAVLIPSGDDMSLAPAVKLREPEKDTTVPANGSPVMIKVEFDTLVDTSVDATSVVTVDGCGAKPDTPLTWSGDTIMGSFDLSQQGYLTIHVVAGQARAFRSGVPLDGNSDPGPGNIADPMAPDGARSPGGDDYVWEVRCAPPVLIKATFAGSGTVVWQQRDPSNGCTQTETYNLTWTTTFTTDPTAPLPLQSGSTLNTYPGKDPTLDVSGSEQTNATCNEFPPPCSGGVSSTPAIFPVLEVLTADTSKKPTRWTIDVQLDPGGSGGIQGSCVADGFGSGGVPLDDIVTSTTFMITASKEPTTQSHTDTIPVSVSRTTSNGNTTLTENWSGTVTVTGTY